MFAVQEPTRGSFLSSMPDLIKALVSLAWVAIAGVAFWKFYRPVDRSCFFLLGVGVVVGPNLDLISVPSA